MYAIFSARAPSACASDVMKTPSFPFAAKRGRRAARTLFFPAQSPPPPAQTTRAGGRPPTASPPPRPFPRAGGCPAGARKPPCRSRWKSAAGRPKVRAAGPRDFLSRRCGRPRLFPPSADARFCAPAPRASPSGCVRFQSPPAWRKSPPFPSRRPVRRRARGECARGRRRRRRRSRIRGTPAAPAPERLRPAPRRA